MGKTKLTIKGEDFYINDKLTYSEFEKINPKALGLLMNARFIQGIYNEKLDPSRFNRYGREFNPDTNTKEFISELPNWYNSGLRAFTIGIQGGGPCFTFHNDNLFNQPYINNGTEIEKEYLDRLDLVLKAADDLGMVAIVSLFYPGQAIRFKTDEEITNSVKTACKYLKESGYKNLIVEICNEYDLCKTQPLLGTGEGMSSLIKLAQSILPDTPIGSSQYGGIVNREVSIASDVILIHGNGQSRGHYYNMIKKAREFSPGKPVVCNEDSQAIGNMVVSIKEHVSWGYYNNMTKQEPPVDWTITRGEDQFFVKRLGIELGLIESTEQETYLQGLEENMTYEGMRWIRLASLYPEKIDFVEFYYDGKLYETVYDEPFMVHFEQNWKQGPVLNTNPALWSVKIIEK